MEEVRLAGRRPGADSMPPAVGVFAAVVGVSRTWALNPRTPHPATSNTNPAARTRPRTTDVSHQRRSTFTRSSDDSNQCFAQFSSVQPVFRPISREMRNGARVGLDLASMYS